MKKTKKHIWLAIIAIIIAGLAFGYAYLTTTLSINGITDIDRNSWDVYFDNVQVTDGSVSGAQEIEAPTITSDTEVEFHVNLKKPGDFYEFTIEARNDGTIDAMIETVEKKLNGVVVTTLPAYLNYTVTYEDDVEIEDNHLLASESLETYKIRIEFKKNISATDLPSTAQSLTLSFGVEYIQASSDAVEVRTIVYTVNDYDSDGVITIGQQIPSNVEIYSSPEEAIAAFGHNIFLKHVVANNIVIATYAGRYRNGDYLLLRADSAFFEQNTTEMNRIFGETNCSSWESNNNNGLFYYCNGNQYGGDVAGAAESGMVYTNIDSYECYVDKTGFSYCRYLED